MKKLIFAFALLLGALGCTKEEYEFCHFTRQTAEAEDNNIREYLAFSQMLSGDVEPDSTKRFKFRLNKGSPIVVAEAKATIEVSFFKPATLDRWAIVVKTPRGTAPHLLIRAGACEGRPHKVGFTLRNGRHFTITILYHAFGGLGYMHDGDEFQQL